MKSRVIALVVALAVVGGIAWLRLVPRSIQPRSPTETTQPTAVTDISRANSDISMPIDPARAKLLKAGGREYELALADPTFSDRELELMLADLNLVFGHLPKVMIDRLPEPLHATLGGESVYLTRRVRFEGATRKWPRIFQDEQFACLIEGDAGERLFVPRSVSDAYRAAIQRHDSHAHAYAILNELLQQLNSLREQPIKNAKDLFRVGEDYRNAKPGVDAITDDQFAAEWSRYSFREPSLLNVDYTRGTPLEPYGELVATVYIEMDGKLDEIFPFAYSEGRWRMVVFNPGT